MAGGDADPNLSRLLRCLAVRGVDHLALLAGAGGSPRLAWRLADDSLWIGGVVAKPTAVFLRHDVFAHMADGRAESRARAGRWYQAVLSWALAHEEVAFPNRAYGARQATKPHILRLAARSGLAVPETLVTNDTEAFGPEEAAGWIAKPVNGGEHTRPLDDALADAEWRRRAGAEPTIVQRRLVGPELRVYRVGERWFAFALRSGALDYRTDARVEVAVVPAPAPLTAPLGRLMDGLGLDFGAADFKTCPDTGRHLFLEVNSAPMFAGFDRVAGGALCGAIVDWLAAPA
ncbi:hypothetical protein GCM10009416_18410 [Craurococcus roseus]|uniref:ATP-grasp domain-containing protein n=1 Tax=Craurococcus roseus TaxID=77585 RepID=A0ABP3Q0G7_9PROT